MIVVVSSPGSEVVLFQNVFLMQDTLHEHLGIMLSVHTAFSDRSSALLTVQTLMSDLASLQLRIEKLEAAASKIFGGDKSRLRKVEELRETIRATEDAKCCALREYERIKVIAMFHVFNCPNTWATLRRTDTPHLILSYELNSIIQCQ